MKWIGQHIWDFISRFRSDVYLENVAESAQDHVVGIDADGKLYKQDVSVGDITGVTAGDALTGGGDSGALTINHEDTSSQASVDNSGSTVIQDVTLDTYGHVTGLTSATLDLGDSLSYSGSTANGVLAYKDADEINVSSNLTYTDSFSILHLQSSLNGSLPSFTMQNGHAGTAGSMLKFVKTKSGADDDELGRIVFQGEDDGGQAQNYATLEGYIAESAAGQEAGSLLMKVYADSTQNLTGLQITGHPTVSKLDVAIGSGTTSDTTIAGNLTVTSDLTVSGTTTTINTTDLNVEDKNITLNYHATNDTSASADGAGITVQDAVNATTDATINWNATDDTWDFSHKTVMPDFSRVDGRLYLGSASLSTALRHQTLSSSKVIDLPNISGTAAILDPFASSYTNASLSPSAGVYTAVTNLDMAAVYGLNSTAVAITPTPHVSLTIMLTDCWVYVTTPNYTTSGVANTSNWAFQIGKTTGAGTYNKAKGFEGLINRLAYNQPANKTNPHRVTFFPNTSSNYGNAEPGLPLLAWTNIDPSGSASVGSESIMSIRLVTQYTVIPS